MEPRAYHPLLCHMIDVAMVARLLWRDALSPAQHRWLTEQLGLPDEDAAGRWLALLAGAHDLGKCSPPFVRKHGAAVKQLTELGLPFPRIKEDAPHGKVSAAALPDLLVELGMSYEAAVQAATVVGGHHGTFPIRPEVVALSSRTLGTSAWEQARRELFRALVGVAPPGDASPRLPTPVAMAVAGLVSVADWIGSNQEYFTYESRDGAVPASDPAEYAQRAARRAEDALEALHWTTWQPAREARDFRALFGLDPRDLQAAVVEIAAAIQRPGLVLIEAPMGEGKTEAALYLADSWGVSPGLRGCYVALPTQATSNQMFGRVTKFLARRYPGGAANVVLLHGHAALSAELQLLREQARLFRGPTQICDDEPDGPAAPSVIAAEWFTHRKRGLLAPFGVGTVDQALLAALQTRHGFVRLFGLAGKTVILDEVHAYDAYMTELLERLLEWLAALGCGVVLLSATLPASKRQALVNAYLRGAGYTDAAAHPKKAYPRITWTDGRPPVARTVKTSQRRRVRIEHIPGQLPELPNSAFPLAELPASGRSHTFPLADRLAKVLGQSGRMAIVCNTVARAQRVYAGLVHSRLGTKLAARASDGGPRLDLFHARYLHGERQEREDRVLERFGPLQTERSGPDLAVVVATQVIEQSLDLDFDLLVTDLAPIDLVLQRSGRLHRHQRDDRPPGLRRPRLWILWPEEDAAGLPVFDPGSVAVYDEHTLLRSWLALRDRGALRVPEDVETLIEAVYDDRPCPDEALRAAWERTRTALQKQKRRAQDAASRRLIRGPQDDVPLWGVSPDRLEDDNPELHQAFQALTRLGDPSVSVACLFDTPRGPALDPAGTQLIRLQQEPTLEIAARILERSIQVGDRRVVGELLKRAPPSGWQDSALLRRHRLLLEGANGWLQDADHAERFGRCRLRLDAQLGLLVVAEGTLVGEEGMG
jgi:CRISPR-associated endonuclease/helicase Cas3